MINSIMEISKHRISSSSSSSTSSSISGNNNDNSSNSNSAGQLGILLTGHDRPDRPDSIGDSTGSRNASVSSDTAIGLGNSRANSGLSDPHASPSRNGINDSETTTAATRTQAAFVNKLYKMLEDPGIHHLICWSDSGELFSVRNPTAFSKTVLPQYFKHNNWQSFVRQLNMYGFHKVNDMIHSNLTAESQNWEFRHPHFRRGAVDELKNIKRKSAKSRHQLSNRIPTPSNPSEGDDFLYGPMYQHILGAEERLMSASKAFEILQQQITNLKTVISGQQEIIGDTVDVMMSLCQEDPVSRTKVEIMKQRFESLILSTNSSTLHSPFIPPAPEPSTSLGDYNRHPMQTPAATATMASASTSSSPIPNNSMHPLSYHRLPPINIVHSGLPGGNIRPTMLTPPAGYSFSAAGDDMSSVTLSDPPSLLQDSIRREPPDIHQHHIHGSSHGEERPHTSYLGLGRQSQILNPVPLVPPSSEQRTKGVKRIRSDTT